VLRGARAGRWQDGPGRVAADRCGSGKITEGFLNAFEARLKPTAAGEVVAAPAAPVAAPSRMMWWLAGAALVLA
jgi:hypothetical protein